MAAMTFLVSADAGPAPAPDQRRREGIFCNSVSILLFHNERQSSQFQVWIKEEGSVVGHARPTRIKKCTALKHEMLA